MTKPKLASIAILTAAFMLSVAQNALAAPGGATCPPAPAVPRAGSVGTIPGYGRGATPEQRRALEAAYTGLSAQYGICRNTVLAIAQAVGATSPDIDLNELLRRIEVLAKTASDLRDQIGELNAKLAALGDPAALAIVAAAKSAVDDGRLADAEREFAKPQLTRGFQGDAGGDAWASAVKARANVKMLQQDYDGATALLLQAAQDNAVTLTHIRFEILLEAAGAQYAKGDLRGDNDALRKAITIYREQVLPLAPRERAPVHWAVIQMRLGNALATLGDRENSTARLEEAVAAFRAALQELTRERDHLNWAVTQNNLGNALQTLGKRESGTAKLEGAVAAYHAALQELTRERTPSDWAMTQNNLGAALANLGERESGTARLEEAVAAYRAALQVRTRDRLPFEWAMTQNNLGDVLTALGDREGDAVRLEEAVVAYRTALQEVTRERAPLAWASIQNNLGTALQSLGERESGTAKLEGAVAAYREALKESTRERVPLDWAMIQNNLGNALATLGERESGTARLEEAVAAYRAALQVRTRDRVPLQWANTQFNLGMAYLPIGRKTGDVATLRQAEVAFANALAVYAAAHNPSEQKARKRLTAVQAEIERRDRR